MSRREQEHRRQRKRARREARVAARGQSRRALETMRHHRTLGSAVRHALRGYRPPDALLEELRRRNAANLKREDSRRRLIEQGAERLERMVAHERA